MSARVSNAAPRPWPSRSVAEPVAQPDAVPALLQHERHVELVDVVGRPLARLRRRHAVGVGRAADHDEVGRLDLLGGDVTYRYEGDLARLRSSPLATASAIARVLPNMDS